MKLTDALSLQEGLDPAIVNDIVDIAMRPEFGSISGMDKVAEKEWEDISQLIRYIKEAIPTTTHYLFDTEVSKLEDRLPDTEFDQNLNEISTHPQLPNSVQRYSDAVTRNEYGLPGNPGREFGEKFMREFITPGKFAQLWTAFEATYPELQPELQKTFEKTNNLLKYIKPSRGDEAYRVSKMPEVAAQELDDLLNDALEMVESASNQTQQPSIEMTKETIRHFDNIFEDMLMIFTSNTAGDAPLEPYKQTKIGFREDKIMENKIKLAEIYEETSAYNTAADYKELQAAWRKLDNEQRFDLLLSFVKDPHDEPDMEWDELWNQRPMLANNPDFQEALIDSEEQIGYDKGWYGEGSINEEFTSAEQFFNKMSDEEKKEVTSKWTVGGADENIIKSYNEVLNWLRTYVRPTKNLPEKELLKVLNQEIMNYVKENQQNEGTCGYSIDGKGGDKPAGSHLLKKSDLKESEIRKMIKKQIKEIKNPNSRSSKLTDLINEENFDKRLAQQMGMSDDEFEDKIASRDIGDEGMPFPGSDDDIPPGYRKASDLKDKLRKQYRNMSNEELNEFSKEMVLHFLDNTAAQAAAKVFFGRRGL